MKTKEKKEHGLEQVETWIFKIISNMKHKNIVESRINSHSCSNRLITGFYTYYISLFIHNFYEFAYWEYTYITKLISYCFVIWYITGIIQYSNLKIKHNTKTRNFRYHDTFLWYFNIQQTATVEMYYILRYIGYVYIYYMQYIGYINSFSYPNSAVIRWLLYIRHPNKSLKNRNTWYIINFYNT